MYLEESPALLGVGLVPRGPVFLDPSANSGRDLIAFGRAVSTQNAGPSSLAPGFQEGEAKVNLQLVIALALDLQSANIDFGE